MLCIEPENVVVPSLHVSLGIFKRLYDLLEEECNTLDNTIFNYQVECEEEASQDSQDSQDLVDNNFTQTIRSAKNRLHALKTSIQKKEAKLEDLIEDLPLQLLKLSQVENDKVPTDDDDALQDIIVKQQCLREQIAQMQKELDELKMAFGSGPVSSVWTTPYRSTIFKTGLPWKNLHRESCEKACQVIFSEIAQT
ncbi:uncharacterized protein [Amphiura filiformis]|uniref:uncharacterized protein n=1 Tax=Amphiura filiformis TaxID=82378 RepID=UPI003B219753